MSAITPDGREYIIADKLPANKLPKTIFTNRVKNANLPPSKSAVKRIKTFESPSFAPGKIMGGKRLSSVNVSVDRVASIAHSAIFEELIFAIITPLLAE
jgi:hypothetical protein